jgi:hypothetical protein
LPLENYRNIYIFAEDISGAQQVLAFIKRTPNQRLFFSLKGLGKKYIEDALGSVTSFKKSEIGRLNPAEDCILIGTGANPSHYIGSLLQAKKQGIYTAAILEHYCNYAERFENTHEAFPELILTTDMFAYNVAQQVYTDSEIKLIPDYFFIDQKKIFNSTPKVGNQHPTYFSQNIQNLHFNDIDCIEFFIKNKFKCDELTKNNSNVLVVRNHPTENPKKYMGLMKKFKNIEIQIDQNKNFIETLRNTSYVVGLDTNPMFVSLKLGMPVFCSSPDFQWNMSADLGKVIYVRDI